MKWFPVSIKRLMLVASVIFSVIPLSFCLPDYSAADNETQEFKEGVEGLISAVDLEMKATQQRIDDLRKANERTGHLELRLGVLRGVKCRLELALGTDDKDNLKYALATRQFFDVAAVLLPGAFDLLYGDIPGVSVAKVLKGLRFAAKMKGLVKTAKAFEKAAKAAEELEDIKDKIEKAKKIKELLNEVKKTVSSLPVPQQEALVVSPGVDYSIAGRGVTAGEIFDATFTNTSACPGTVSIPIGSVFGPSDTRYQQMIIGESYSLDLPPGATISVVLIGYCIDPERLPPAKPADNPSLSHAFLDTAALAQPQQRELAFLTTIIMTGNQLSDERRYETPLPPAQAKTTVIQWTIWHVRKPDAYTQAKLEEEVTKQFKAGGMDVTTPQTKDEIRRGTAQIWGSVNLTLKQAKARQTTDIPMLTAGPGEQEDCDVKIEGKDIVCLFCKGDSLSTSLKAVGTPGGGRYEWEIIGGEDRVALPPRRNRASVEVTGQKSSGNKEDVEVKVTYSVKGKTCPDTHKLTVLKPSKLRLKKDHQFVVKDRNLQLTAGLAEDLRKRLEAIVKQSKKDETDGPILIRDYEVLDQFDDVIQCGGKLTEEISGADQFRVGGTKIKQGIPENPDHLYHFQKLEKGGAYKEKTVLQSIKVLGCIVRYNKITFKPDTVHVEELTKENYDNEKNKIGH